MIGVLDADAGPPAAQQTQEEPVHKVKYTAKFKPGQDYTILVYNFSLFLFLIWPLVAITAH